VNDLPALELPGPELVFEDSPAQTKQLRGISSGAPNEPQTISVTATSDRRDLIPDPVVAYTSPATTAVLTYTPAKDAAGVVNISVMISDGEATLTNKFTVTLQEINDPPFFTQGRNVTVSQDSGLFTETAWARNLSTGPASEAGQKLSFRLVPDNAALFSLAPAISSTGTLTFTPAPGASGLTDVRIFLSDDGGTVSGGQNTLAPAPFFTITILKVAASPIISLNISEFTLEEDKPSAPINFKITDADSPVDALKVSARALDPALVPSTTEALAIRHVGGNDYTLVITPARNASGTTVITLTVADESNNPSQRDFTLTVLAGNDPPAFTKGPDVTLLEDAGPQTIPGWATGISTGAADEAAQQLQFAVTNDNPALFLTQPAISPAGELSFTTATNAFGLAEITVQLQDNGGVANGGTDTSAQQAFTITVTPVNDPPQLGTVNTYGIDEDQAPVTAALFGISAGAPNENQTLTITAKSSNPAIVPDPEIVYLSPETIAFLTFRSSTNSPGG
jgi:hypothetical protein